MASANNTGALVGTVTGGKLQGFAISGNLATVTTDSVSVAAPGNQFATVRFLVNNAGTATATAQFSNNGGTEWLAAAYARRVDVASGVGGNGTTGNPTVQAIIATTLVTGQAWEIRIPSNCTHFRLLCGGTGTATNVTVQGGVLYSPGAPVVGVLYDVTSAVNTAIDTGIIDTSGWLDIRVTIVTPAGGGAKIYSVDDLGNSVFGGALGAAGTATFNMAAGSQLIYEFASQTSATITGGSGTGQGVIAAGLLFKRMDVFSAAVAALTSRVRIEVSR